MAPSILLVDDERDILHLLHSVLDTLQNPNLEIIEAGSGEAALQEVESRHVDLLITDYNLPGLTGLELVRQVRAGRPETGVIVITANSDRKIRDEILNVGVVAVFSKPVPLGDFLDAVERGLGLTRTILPMESAPKAKRDAPRVSELLVDFRREMRADAVLLISNRGLVVARAGDLRDSSMEVSLISALTATFSAGLKVAESNRQETLNQHSVFNGGDQDLLLMPVDASYTLLLAGRDLADPATLPDTLQAMRVVKDELAKGLHYIGAESLARRRRGTTGELKKDVPELDALLSATPDTGMSQEELDAYWDSAAAQHANKPLSKDAIPYEEARKMGLTPDSQES